MEGSDDELGGSPRKGGRRLARLLRRRVPVLAWGARYTRLDALADLVAGVTLGLTLVPQAIAYAALAGLPLHYGLYSSFIGTILYVFLGTVKEVSIGPTSLMALLTLQTTRGLPVQYVVLLTFLSGCVVTLTGLLQLGFLVELISPAVSSGFTSGTAVIIVLAQLKGLLGLSFTAESIIENVTLIARNVRRVRLADCLLSLVCCTVLLLLRKLKDLKVSPKKPVLCKCLWLLSIGRNAIIVCAGAIFAYCTHDPADPLVKLSGLVKPGLPPFELPPFSVTQEMDGRNVTVGFTEMVHELGSAVVMLPIVMVLANLAIAKSFSGGRAMDATQEMLTLGVCNVAGSLVHAMPTCGAFTRSAVSHSSGVRTPAAGLYSGIITLVALGFMTQYFYFIPKACLSSVLICAVIFMVDLRIFARLWRCSKPEFLVLSATFMTSLLWTVELAVLVGMLANIAVLLYHTARPAVHVDELKVSGGTRAVRVRPSLALVYMNVSRFTSLVTSAATREAHGTLPVLVDCSRVMLIDYSAVQALERLVKKFSGGDQKLVLYNASSEVLGRLSAASWLCQRRLRARTERDALATDDVTLELRSERDALLAAEKQTDVPMDDKL